MNKALIIFTQAPCLFEACQKFMPLLQTQECQRVQECFLLDVYEKASKTGADLYLFYTPRDHEKKIKHFFEGKQVTCLPQHGENLGERMKNALGVTFRLGYEESILVGSDCPQIEVETFMTAFKKLKTKDIVIHPTLDGGYYLIGMKEEHDSIWDIERYGTNTVIYDTLQHMKKAYLDTAVGQLHYDIDTIDDLKRLYKDMNAGVVSECPNTEQYLNTLGDKLKS